MKGNFFKLRSYTKEKRLESDNISALKKSWNVLVTILLIIELLLVIIFAMPNLFGIKSYVVTSGSMEPRYPVGSLVYVEKTEPLDIKVEDTITFYMSSSEIVATHEVYSIDKENKNFKTRGINNLDSDGNIIPDANPVEFENLIGKTVFCIPYMGFVNTYVTTKPGIYVVLIITLIVVMISFILDNITKKSKN